VEEKEERERERGSERHEARGEIIAKNRTSLILDDVALGTAGTGHLVVNERLRDLVLG